MIRETLVATVLFACVAAPAVPRRKAGVGKTLSECFQAALTRSEIVANQQELVYQAESNYRQAVGSVLPTVSGIGTYGWQDTAPTSATGAQLFPNPNHSARLSATQPLFQGFKEFAGLKLAKASVRASENDRRQATLQLYSDTATSFYTVVSLERDLENVADEVDFYDQRINELKQFQSIGRSRTSEVLTAQSQQALLKAQMQSVQGQLEAQREVLAFLTGFEPKVEVAHPSDGPVASKTLDEYLSRLEARPDVQAEIARLQAAEEAVPVARSGHFPSLGVTGNYYFDRTGVLNQVKWDVTLNLTVPLFAGGIVSAQVDQAQSRRLQAENVLGRARRQATQQIRRFYASYLSDKSQYEAYLQATNLAEKNYKEESRDYRRGLVNNLDVLTALTQFKESKRNLDRAQYAMMLDVENLEAAAANRGLEAPKSREQR